MSAPVGGDPALRALPHFQGARDDPSPEGRLKDLRRRARALREELLDSPPVRYYRAFDLIRVPYPTRYAFLNACSMPTPFVHIVNRLIVVQAETEGGLRTLLISPSDIEANRATPFFRRLRERLGPFEEVGAELLGPRIRTVEQALELAGVAPREVDYISYDHLHTQDLRRWLGSGDTPGVLPRARLLITRQEWESTHGLLPPQRVWYCPDGTKGIDPQRVVLLDGDVRLGPSVALVRTPGHTEGNHSFVVRTPEGLMVSSENGVGPDAYAPRASRIPGLARHARETGVEVILNGNTLEGGLDQYMSMVVEKELAGPSMRNPEFPNVVVTSQLAHYAAFPGIHPTFSFERLCFGEPATPGAAEA